MMRVRSIPAALLASILLLGAVVPAAASTLCLGVRPECCCHSEAEAPAHARLARRCCCDVEQQSSPALPRVHEAAPSPASSPIGAPAPRFVPHGAALVHRAAPHTPVAQLATGPPLILLKRSLLI